MGLFGSIGTALGSVFGGPIGGAAGGVAGGFLENWMGRSNAKSAQDRANVASATQWQREYGAYKKRYQDTMSDMRSAGLNPILAAGGGFNVGSGPHASLPQTYNQSTPSINLASSAQGWTQSKKNIEEAKESGTRQRLNKSQAHLAMEKANTEVVRRNEMSENARRLSNEVIRIEEETNKIAAQVKEAESRTSLNKAQRQKVYAAKKLIQSQVKEIQARLIKLVKASDVYKSPAGKYMIWAQEIFKTIGIPITGGIIGNVIKKGVR